MGEAQKKIEEFGLTTCSNIDKVVSAVQCGEMLMFLVTVS